MKPIKDLLKKEPAVINMGLRTFYESCKDQDAGTVHMDWKPPAGGNKEMMEILEKLR